MNVDRLMAKIIPGAAGTMYFIASDDSGLAPFRMSADLIDFEHITPTTLEYAE